MTESCESNGELVKYNDNVVMLKTTIEDIHGHSYITTLTSSSKTINKFSNSPVPDIIALSQLYIQ